MASTDQILPRGDGGVVDGSAGRSEDVAQELGQPQRRVRRSARPSGKQAPNMPQNACGEAATQPAGPRQWPMPDGSLSSRVRRIRQYVLVAESAEHPESEDHPESAELPEGVLAAYERAARTGFQLACEVEVGRLLAAFAAAVPDGGRILEVGTGVGVGLAWLVHGLGARRDVEVVTVELDDEVGRTALSAKWPPWVRFESGDGAEVVGRLGQFDLIFADAPGGKIFKLRRTVAALRHGGVIVVDDMDLTRHEDEHLRSALDVVRHRLLENTGLVCAELGFSSGVIVAVKRRS
ncbi:MAG TPA: class I SAM-dependent methyltransferase [Streptosporangiaceae bacterium]|nr:class I SAM-dependent methyltransferase [Streptosporangiaceae bacterium]